MKRITTLRGVWVLLAAAATLALGACKPPQDPNGRPAFNPAQSAETTTAGTPEFPREVEIEVADNMKFSVERIEAKAGETLRLVLINTGSATKEAMGHNWVLLRAGVDVTAYANAAVRARDNDYLPRDRASEVLAHTKMLGGRSRDSVVFTVPFEPGDHTYICTFPAHLQLGMKGVLSVR